ncbi:MAG: hypothetical protein ACQZ2J_29305 [Pseudomonas piscis]|uniref:hypothetical protein n=1 Tax=Pseudomonas piscis TaxID=2614538 RepID=UPI003D290E7D
MGIRDSWGRGGKLYLEYLPEAGFERVGDLRQGDVMLPVRSPLPDYAGVYLADGVLKSEPEHYPAPGSILHHLYGHASERDTYDGYWSEVIVSYWRHLASYSANMG